VKFRARFPPSGQAVAIFDNDNDWRVDIGKTLREHGFLKKLLMTINTLRITCVDHGFWQEKCLIELTWAEWREGLFFVIKSRIHEQRRVRQYRNQSVLTMGKKQNKKFNLLGGFARQDQASDS
jgi:hypothetical protein